MIDFWADWCVACHELENETYTDARVAGALRDDFVLLKIARRTSRRGGEADGEILGSGIADRPLHQLEGNDLRQLTLTGFLPPDEFFPLLEKAKACS